MKMEVTINTEKYIGEIREAQKKAIHFVNLAVQHITRKWTPKDTGGLVGSFREGVIDEGNVLKGVVMYNKEYALRQHEKVYRHAGMPPVDASRKTVKRFLPYAAKYLSEPIAQAKEQLEILWINKLREFLR